MQLADARVSERPLFSERDRWFESAFLQQRVQCEPDFLSLACSMIENTRLTNLVVVLPPRRAG
jgi:hypothetical protein